MARGHGGTTPDNFLQTLTIPCERIRIQGCCTGQLQPADRPQANKAFKRLIREEMRKQQIEAVLDKEHKLHSTLTKKARVDISRVLWTVRKRFNSDSSIREQVKDAFRETLWGPNKHSGLKKFLEEAKLKGWEAKCEHTVKCEQGCGFLWKNEASRKSDLSKRRHQPHCWPIRKALLAPLRTGQDPDKEPLGLLFKAKYKSKTIREEHQQ